MMNPQQNDPKPQKPVYSVADTAYAWLCYLFSFLLCQSFPVSKYPLGGFLLLLGMFASGTVLLKLKKRRLSPVCILCGVSAAVIGGAMLLTDTGFLVNLCFACCLASYGFFLYAALGNRIEEGFSDYIYIDFIKLLFIFPFRSLFSFFGALFRKSSGKSSRLVLKVLLGIAIAIMPTAFVFGFLSYDAGFLEILESLFTFESLRLPRILRNLIFAAPLAMYGFGLYASSQRQLLQGKMTAAHCKSGLGKIKILPQLTALIAVLPVLFLYTVFFISQWQYYISGFTGVLPESFSYAGYARQGFFELCAVSVLNLIIIVFIAFFIKRGKNGSCVILKLVATLFCLCTLILISTAVAKLAMYIDCFGLTPKRIYAMWLMALIGIIFVLIALGQFLGKLKVVALCLCVSAVLLAALALCNVSALCARYNTDRYLDGTLETVDTDTLEQLGDSGIPSLVRLSGALDENKDPELKQTVDAILEAALAQQEEEKSSVFSFCVPRALAKAALKDYTT